MISFVPTRSASSICAISAHLEAIFKHFKSLFSLCDRFSLDGFHISWHRQLRNVARKYTMKWAEVAAALNEVFPAGHVKDLDSRNFVRQHQDSRKFSL